MQLEHKVFVDSNILITAFDSTHYGFINANQILRRLQRQVKDKGLIISQYVLSEIIAYVTFKQKYDSYPENLRMEFVEKVYDFMNSRYVDLLYASKEEASAAFDLIRNFPNIAASLADWISLILMVRHNIPVIQTFDKDFEIIEKTVKQFKGIIIWKR